MPNATNAKRPPLFSGEKGQSLTTKPTRTEKTESNYQIQYRKLLKRLPKFGIAHQLCLPSARTEVWVANLLWYKEFRKKSTFRQYKAIVQFNLAEIEGRRDDSNRIDTLLKQPNAEVQFYEEVIKKHTEAGQISHEKRSRGRPRTSNNKDFEEFDIETNYEVSANQIRIIKETPQMILNGGKAVGPAAKAKRVDKHQVEQMLDYLNKEGRKRGTVKELCFLMVLCSQAFGLRPSEWANARITDAGLLVYNGKHTNGRANGERRLIPLFSRQMYSLLRKEVPGATHETCALCAETYFKETKFCFPLLFKLLIEIDRLCGSAVNTNNEEVRIKRKTILESRLRFHARVFDELKPNLSLYSGRHQFAANMKNFLNPDVVAKLMGHESNQTADRNYSRKTRGSAAFKNLSSQIMTRKELTFNKKGQVNNNNSNDQQSDWSFPQP